jgi:hypothetical protein
MHEADPGVQGPRGLQPIKASKISSFKQHLLWLTPHLKMLSHHPTQYFVQSRSILTLSGLGSWSESCCTSCMWLRCRPCPVVSPAHAYSLIMRSVVSFRVSKTGVHQDFSSFVISTHTHNEHSTKAVDCRISDSLCIEVFGPPSRIVCYA